MDIASDSTLLVTASADKSVKLWGLDFGDCHRSLLAHGDSVMAVRFVPNTHYFFSAGKDRMIKYWDGDKVGLAPAGRVQHRERLGDGLSPSSRGGMRVVESTPPV